MPFCSAVCIGKIGQSLHQRTKDTCLTFFKKWQLTEAEGEHLSLLADLKTIGMQQKDFKDRLQLEIAE